MLFCGILVNFNIGAFEKYVPPLPPLYSPHEHKQHPSFLTPRPRLRQNGAPDTATDLIFAARLTPYRSLGPQGFNILDGELWGWHLFHDRTFFLYPWPLASNWIYGTGFISYVYWAFKANYASAKSYEEVEISRRHVLLQKVSQRGKKTEP